MSEVIFTNEMDEEMTLNMGPHHPSTHGVLRFIIQSDGEIIRKEIAAQLPKKNSPLVKQLIEAIMTGVFNSESIKSAITITPK